MYWDLLLFKRKVKDFCATKQGKGQKSATYSTMSVRKSAKTSRPAQFYKMSQNHSFCLHSHFSQTRENRLKCSRRHFCTLFQKEALKKQKHRNYLIHRRKILTIHRALFAPKCRFAKYALQNTYFSPVFAHILA